MTFRDKTFCASKNCTNKCGHKMTTKESEQLERLKKREGVMVSYSYLCDEEKQKRAESTAPELWR